MALPRPEHPITWPVHRPIIASNVKREDGPLRVYEWHEYLSKDVLNSFSDRYGIEVEAASFSDRNQALNDVIGGPQREFDIFFPTVQMVGPMVERRLLAPLNHDYLTNLDNLWSQFTGDNPFYDSGQRYTIPYTVFSTGIAWRNDLLDAEAAPKNAADPYDLVPSRDLIGRTTMYDDYREAIAFTLLHNGIDDMNTADLDALHRAQADLIAYVTVKKGGLSGEAVYEDLPKGTQTLAQSWSGDFMAAPFYEQNDPYKIAPTLSYYWPEGGIVGVDLIAVLARARNPVLAHLFINHLLDQDVSMQNFTWNGYQPPLTSMNVDTLIQTKIGEYAPNKGPGSVAPSLPRAIVREEMFAQGYFELELSPDDELKWQTAYQNFLAGA